MIWDRVAACRANVSDTTSAISRSSACGERIPADLAHRRRVLRRLRPPARRRTSRSSTRVLRRGHCIVERRPPQGRRSRGPALSCNSIYTAVTNSPAWERMVLIFNYDELGGFFDHVPPPILPRWRRRHCRRQHRWPAGLPDAAVRRVAVRAKATWRTRSTITRSILDMIEWRWSLPRSASAMRARRTSRTCWTSRTAPRAARQYPVPPIVSGEACAVVVPPTDESIVRRGVAFNSSASDVATLPGVAPHREALREVAHKHGWDAIAKL